MRKFLLFSLMLIWANVIFAQNKTVKGRVTSTEDGTGLPGVSVMVKGTSRGAITDANGNYSIEASPSSTLNFSYIGFVNQAVVVGDKSDITLALKTDSGLLNEVVVTAQGIRKSAREIGYALSKVTTDDVTVGRSPQLAQALSGKVTGLAVYNVNNGVDPSVKIVLRGFRSLTGNNEALVVVDGMQTTATILALINPNDIDNVSILKGGQAATLYGSAGINGALVITTRKGGKGKPKVSFSNSTNFEEISFLPAIQNKYGNGSAYYPNTFGSAGYDADYMVRMKANWRSYENQQYGDPFDGQPRLLGRVNEKGNALILPYSAIDNVRRKTFDKGVSMNNQASVSGGDEVSNYYLSIENQKIKGIVPHDKSERVGVRLAASRDFSPKLTTGFTIGYTQATYDRTSFDFYNGVLNQPANLPLYQYKDWKNTEFATPNDYYNDYYKNPYFEADNNRMNYKDANIIGNINFVYKPLEWLQFTERIGVMNNSRIGKNRQNKFEFSDYAKKKAYIPAPYTHDDDELGIYLAISDVQGNVFDYTGTENIINNEFQAQLSKTVGNFSNRLVLGSSLYNRSLKFVGVGSTSVVVPDFFNSSSRQGELIGGEGISNERKFGYYADVTSNFKNWLIFNATLRYDATSKFYKPDRAKSSWAYPYYGAALSFVATDAIPNLKSNAINFIKLRASANKNANDNIPMYGLDLAYNAGNNFPYGNIVGLTVGNTLPDANLKPEIVYSYEVGGEFQLFNNRVNLDLAAYTQSSNGQVVTAKIPSSTGFPNLLINVGETKNWGYEVDLKYLIARKGKWYWDFGVRYSFNDNKVIGLYPGIDQFQYGGFTYANTNVIKGERFPMLKTNGYIHPADNPGNVLVNATTGYPILNTTLENRGGTLPRHIAGLGSKLTYGNVSFNFNFEYRGGNVMFSDLGRQMTFTGSGAWTENRSPQIFPNSSISTDGGKTSTVNTTVQVREPEYALWVNNYRLISENFVNPAWFLKLRDVNLTYKVPTSIIEKSKIFSSASIAIYGRNLLTIVDKKNFYTDPEFSYQGQPAPGSAINGQINGLGTANGIGINTTMQTPPVRQYGINLNFSF